MFNARQKMKIILSLLLTLGSLQLISSHRHHETFKKIEITPASLETVNNKTYFISNRDIYIDVDNAIGICNDAGMSLVSLETEEEYRALDNYLTEREVGSSQVQTLVAGDAGQIYWTSGRQFEDKWHWTGSGRYFTFVNWGGGEPSNSGCSMCIYLRAGSGYEVKICTAHFGFVCETN